MEKWVAKLRQEQSQAECCSRKIKELYQIATQFAENPFRDYQQKEQAKARLQTLFAKFLSEFRVKYGKATRCAKKFEPKGIIKYAKAYRCQDCSKQHNSVVCLECFSREKHLFHKYQLINVKGGCCDCGDDSKWERQSFCSRHKHSTRQMQQIQISQSQLESYRLFLQHSLKILTIFYYARKQEMMNCQATCRDNQIQKIDLFGSLLFQTIIAINIKKPSINSITLKVFDEKLTFEKELRFCPQLHVKYLLLRFIQLRLTSIRCVELLMLLFNSSQVLRKEITLYYFNLYAEIPGYIRSSYNQFSSQILTNSQIISQLLDHQQLALTFQFFELQNLGYQKQMQLLSKDIQIYFRDLKYLINLQLQSSKKYWKKQIETQNLVKIIQSYQLMAASYQSLKLAYKTYYYIQEQFLEVWAPIVDKFLQDQQLCQKTLQQLTKQLLNNRLPNKPSLFATLPRMWGHVFLAYFYRYLSPATSLDDIKIEDLSKITQIPKQELLGLTTSLFEQIVNSYYVIAQTMKSKDEKNQKLSFASTYFMTKKYSLFSVDAFILRTSIALLCSAQKQCQVSEIITGTLDKILTVYLSALKNIQITNLSCEFKSENLFYISQSLSIFVNLYEQSLHSDLIDLTLLAHHPQIISNSYQIQQKYLGFYSTILRSLKAQLNPTQFRSMFRAIFFKETVCFDHFVSNTSQNQIINKQAINIQAYVSVIFKINSKNMRHYFKDCQQSQTCLQNVHKYNNFWLKTSFLKLIQNIGDQTKQIKSNRQIIWKKIDKLLRRLHKDYNSPQCYQMLIKMCNFDSRQPHFYSSIGRTPQSSQKPGDNIFQVDDSLKQARLLSLIQAQQQQRKQKINDCLSAYYLGTCIFNEKCIQKTQKQLYLLSFVNYSHLYHTLSPIQNHLGLKFVTCGHLCHTACYQLYSKQPFIQSCAKCHQNYNCLLKKRSNHSEHLFGFQHISQQFQRIANVLDKSIVINIQQSIFVSILAFFANNLVTHTFDCYSSQLLLYKDLFLKLRQYIQHQKNSTNLHEIAQLRLDFDENSNLSPFVNILRQKLLRLLCQHTSIQSIQISPSSPQQNAYIDKVVDFLVNPNLAWNIQRPSNIHFFNENKLFQHIVELLPDYLSEIAHQSAIKCCICHKQASFLYICLLHPIIGQHPEFSYCHNCFQLNVIKHIKKHHVNQILFLETDSGRPTYLFVDQISEWPTDYEESEEYRENKYLYQMGSLYENDQGKSYFPKNYKEKDDFELSIKKVKEMVSQMLTGTFALLASNQYKYQ